MQFQAVDLKCVGVHSKPHIRRPRSLSDKRARNDVIVRCIAKEIGIEQPKERMKVPFTVTFGFSEQRQEHFVLSGWYQSYVKDRKERGAYISEGKAASLGCDLEQESDILICPKNRMSWEETEQKLYEDLVGERTDIIITVRNPFAYEAFRKMAGGYWYGEKWRRS